MSSTSTWVARQRASLAVRVVRREPDQALRLVEAVVGATHLPVTLKMRLGWDDDNLNAPDIAKRAQNAGVRMLVIHGRTRKQFFRGTANWAAIRAVVEAVTIPVIANGDIGTAEQARTALAQSGAAGVMVGRAAQGKPWLPGAIEHALRHGSEISAPPRERLLQSLLELYEHTLAFYDHGLGLRIARKHIAWMIDAEFGAAAREVRKSICMMEGPRAVRAALIQLFDGEPMREAA
jgi:tRNA-dihydrouridine synthase B